MTPKAVIFDCDGVVIDSEEMLFDLLSADLATYGLMLTTDQLHTRFVGGTLEGISKTCRSLGADLPDTWVTDFYEQVYSALRNDAPLVPGILNVLNALDTAKIPYAMGSNGSDEKMQITLGQHAGLRERFQGRIFSGQSLGKPKPAPDLFLHAAKALNTAPADCIVIEDSPTGAQAARAAGMRCMGYAPHGNAAALSGVGAIIFSDMNDLPTLLGL